MQLKIGDKVRILVTGDDKIDQYAGQCGRIAEVSRPKVTLGDSNLRIYRVNLDDGAEVTVNHTEVIAL